VRRTTNTGRTDGNQHEVIAALNKAGITVQTLASVGNGCPDLLCGYRNRNVLLEVKDGTRKPSEQALTVQQKEWHAKWGGTVHTVTSADEAVLAVLSEVGDIRKASIMAALDGGT